MDYRALFLFWIAGILTLITLTDSQSVQKDPKKNDPEKRLFNKLFKSYRTSVRPIFQKSQPVKVEVNIDLHQIVELSEKSQFLHMSLWVRMSWIDEHLTWDQDKFEGLAEIQVPSRDIWKPDITIVNNVDDSKSAMKLFSDTPAKVYPNGTVYWLTSSLCKISCKINVENFPFDEQHCTIVLSPWTSDIRFINLTYGEPEGNSGPFVIHGVWDLQGIPVEREEVLYPCCPDPYVEVRYTVVVRRQPNFYLYNQLFPCIPLMLISVLVFCLPTESGERASLAVTLLLAMTVFLNFISENMPPTSEVVPLLAQFFGAAIVLLSVCTSVTVLILNIHYQGEHGKPTPKWLKVIFLDYIGHYLHIKRKPKDRVNESKDGTDGVEKNGTFHASSLNTVYDNRNGDMDMLVSQDSLGHQMQNINCVLALLHEEITTRNREKSRAEDIKEEWQLIAMTFDRMLFIVFIICNVLVNVSIFTKVAFVYVDH
ncbi:unnamed protein product [Owenia fusiformis]|uniref:Uncharacterized protein n=1 Tax=Owenia fusiformis TaxID=6347 RepID=A0A8J1T5J7_OWEFU|nr:unnamed protein product [Owenia fusiformis]